MAINIRPGEGEKPTSGQRDGNQFYIGFVHEVDGTTPGPASGIKYKILLNLDSGTYITPIMSPIVPRWPDTVNIVALQLGQPVIVARSKTTYYLLTAEMPSLEECAEPEAEP